MSKDLSARYYQQKRKRTQKSLEKGIKIFPKKRKNKTRIIWS